MLDKEHYYPRLITTKKLYRMIVHEYMEMAGSNHNGAYDKNIIITLAQKYNRTTSSIHYILSRTTQMVRDIKDEFK